MMRPARMPSRYRKLLPWYYIFRDPPSRAASDAEAIAADWAAVGSDLQQAVDEFARGKEHRLDTPPKSE